MKYLIILASLLTLLNIALGQSNNPNSINNPENEEFVVEVAFNIDKDTSEVTQREFDERYSDFVVIINDERYYIYASDPERAYGTWIEDRYVQYYALDKLILYLQTYK